MALADENEKLRDELQRNLIEGDSKPEGANRAEVEELMMANQSLDEQIKLIQAQHKSENKKNEVKIAELTKKLQIFEKEKDETKQNAWKKIADKTVEMDEAMKKAE